MNKIWWIVPVLVVLIFVLLGSKKSTDLVKPAATVVPTSTPISVPKEYKFDSLTDLKKELDSINPQVLESDFEQ